LLGVSYGKRAKISESAGSAKYRMCFFTADAEDVRLYYQAKRFPQTAGSQASNPAAAFLAEKQPFPGGGTTPTQRGYTPFLAEEPT